MPSPAAPSKYSSTNQSITGPPKERASTPMKSSVTLLSKQANIHLPIRKSFTQNQKAKRGIPATPQRNHKAGQARSHTLMPVSTRFLFSLVSHKRMLAQISSPHAPRMSVKQVFNTACRRQRIKAVTQPRKPLPGWPTRAATATVAALNLKDKH